MIGGVYFSIFSACINFNHDIASYKSFFVFVSMTELITAEPEEIREFFKNSGKQVLTFVGYSGAGYENMNEMVQLASEILDEYDPATTIVNIGATACGIGTVYHVAKAKGFQTTGIASTKILKEHQRIAEECDKAFFVKDVSYGGYIHKTKTLYPTSQVIVDNTDIMVALGGGDVSAAEFEFCKNLFKKTIFHPLECNHKKRIARAKKGGEHFPKTFASPVSEVAYEVYNS